MTVREESSRELLKEALDLLLFFSDVHPIVAEEFVRAAKYAIDANLFEEFVTATLKVVKRNFVATKFFIENALVAAKLQVFKDYISNQDFLESLVRLAMKRDWLAEAFAKAAPYAMKAGIFEEYLETILKLSEKSEFQAELFAKEVLSMLKAKKSLNAAKSKKKIVIKG